MIKAYTNKYNTYQNIRGVLESNTGICESVVILKKLVNEYFALMEEIIEKADESKKKTNTYTRKKYKLKELMAEKASALGGAGSIYAIDTNDPELIGALKHNFSDIKYATDVEASNHARGIERTLRANLSHLADYMITREDLDDLRKTIKEYDGLLETRGSVKALSVAAKQSLALLYRKMDDLLEKKLDPMIKRVGRIHPEFAGSYFEARKIYDR